jgi:hypothetical protein
MGLFDLTNPALNVRRSRTTLALSEVVNDHRRVLYIVCRSWQSVLRDTHARRSFFFDPTGGNRELQ